MLNVCIVFNMSINGDSINDMSVKCLLCCCRFDVVICVCLYVVLRLYFLAERGFCLVRFISGCIVNEISVNEVILEEQNNIEY